MLPTVLIFYLGDIRWTRLILLRDVFLLSMIIQNRKDLALCQFTAINALTLPMCTIEKFVLSVFCWRGLSKMRGIDASSVMANFRRMTDVKAVFNLTVNQKIYKSMGRPSFPLKNDCSIPPVPLTKRPVDTFIWPRFLYYLVQKLKTLTRSCYPQLQRVAVFSPTLIVCSAPFARPCRLGASLDLALFLFHSATMPKPVFTFKRA